MRTTSETYSNNYYGWPRNDVEEMVPKKCQKILDVGAGFGGLGRTLNKRGNVEMYGIEMNPDAADSLQKAYKKYWIASVDDVDLNAYENYFDCIIFADILEHLYDPRSVLIKYKRLLRSDGYLIISIPNIRNFNIIYDLTVKGRWTYKDAGILDKTHLRFFTRAELEILIKDCGFEIDRIKYNLDWFSRKTKLLMWPIFLLIPELKVFQHLIRATIKLEK